MVHFSDPHRKHPCGLVLDAQRDFPGSPSDGKGEREDGRLGKDDWRQSWHSVAVEHAGLLLAFWEKRLFGVADGVVVFDVSRVSQVDRKSVGVDGACAFACLRDLHVSEFVLPPPAKNTPPLEELLL